MKTPGVKSEASIDRGATRWRWSLAILIAYLLIRGSLGAVVNAPGIGPDERGHVQYIQTFTGRSASETGGVGREGGLANVTGVEARQPVLAYLPASGIWMLSGGPENPIANEVAPMDLAGPILAVRLLSVAWSGVTAWVIWRFALILWPSQPWMALLGTLMATSAPGYLFVMASISNDPMATATITLALLATARVIKGVPSVPVPSRYPLTPLAWWIASTVLAIATKLTALPVITGTVLAIIWAHRQYWPTWWRRRAFRVGTALLATASSCSYAFLLTKHPTSSYAAAAARIWPQAILAGLNGFLAKGGLTESFRTFWHAFDYSVQWQEPLDTIMTVIVAIPMTFAIVGLVMNVIGVAHPQNLRAASMDVGAMGRWDWTVPIPPILWLTALCQIAFAIIRYGIGDISGSAMGGVAQAKTFFPAIAPLGLIGAAGLATALTGLTRIWRRLRPAPLERADTQGFPGHWLLPITFMWVSLVDVTSLAISFWRHYQWWVG
ncbi:MAG: hypothetical protein EXR45_09630 [Chloroflexi bacterium]|nr:hypothetical protein [Chloroflexota bacterium]